jgi:uncharacterized integral membrane protein
MGALRGWAAAVIGVVLLVVLFQNLDRTSVNLLFWRIEAPLLAIMAVCAAAGAVLGALAVVVYLARRRGR